MIPVPEAAPNTYKTWLALGGFSGVPYEDYSGKAEQVIIPTPDAAPGGGPGGKKRRRTSRYPRWILIDGKRIQVANAQEERRLLEAYQARLEAEKAALEAQDAPQAKIAPLRVKVARTERRIDEADEREAEWKAKLRRIDSELVLMLG